MLQKVKEGIRMLRSRFFTKYYPIKDVSDLFYMSQNDREVLGKWLRTIQSDVEVHNYSLVQNAGKRGFDKCTQICISYDRDISLLAEKICKISSNYSEIDERDVDFINDVIYRHKYIWFISSYCFPIRNKDTKNNYLD